MNLTALASFNLVASHGGFSQAARAARQSKATLSRHVRQLEDELGVRLVERGDRALRLTHEGADLHARTLVLLAEIEEAGADIGERRLEPRGRLRVSAPQLFADIAMGSLGAAFAKRYPEVVLDVTGEDRVVDPVAEGYDVIIRVDPHPDSELVGQCFLRDDTVLVASSSLGDPLDAKAKPAKPLAAIVLNSKPDEPIWSIRRDGQIERISVRPVLRLSSLVVIREAARAGAGFALLPRSLVALDVDEGRLSLWGSAQDREVEVWALHTSRRHVSPKVSAFVTFLCEAHPERKLLGALS